MRLGNSPWLIGIVDTASSEPLPQPPDSIVRSPILIATKVILSLYYYNSNPTTIKKKHYSYSDAITIVIISL